MKQLSVPSLYWLSDVWELVTEAWAQLLNCQTEIESVAERSSLHHCVSRTTQIWYLT